MSCPTPKVFDITLNRHETSRKSTAKCRITKKYIQICEKKYQNLFIQARKKSHRQLIISGLCDFLLVIYA